MMSTFSKASGLPVPEMFGCEIIIRLKTLNCYLYTCYHFLPLGKYIEKIFFRHWSREVGLYTEVSGCICVCMLCMCVYMLCVYYVCVYVSLIFIRPFTHSRSVS